MLAEGVLSEMGYGCLDRLRVMLCLNSENPKGLKRDVENSSSLLDTSFLILPSHGTQGTRQVSDAIAVMSNFKHHLGGVNIIYSCASMASERVKPE